MTHFKLVGMLSLALVLGACGDKPQTLEADVSQVGAVAEQLGASSPELKSLTDIALSGQYGYESPAL